MDGSEAPAFLKIPQKMQPGTLGEGGSRAGATRRVWKPWLPSSWQRLCSAPSLRLRSCSPTEPTLRECLSSLNSVAPVPSGSPWLPSCEDMSLSSQTKPDEPDLLKVCEDRCSPAMVTHLCSLVCDWRCLCVRCAMEEEEKEWYGRG